MLPVKEIARYLREFYPGKYGELAAEAFSINPSKYITRLLTNDGVNGVLSYEIIDFDTIDIKLLAGGLQSIKRLIDPIKVCNLSIKVPESLDDYIGNLSSVGFRVEGGQSLLYLTRSGDVNG